MGCAAAPRAPAPWPVRAAWWQDAKPVSRDKVPVVARRLFNAMCDKGPIRREDWKAVLAGLNPREVKPPPAAAAYQRGGKPRAITVPRASTSK